MECILTSGEILVRIGNGSSKSYWGIYEKKIMFENDTVKELTLSYDQGTFKNSMDLYESLSYWIISVLTGEF